jgi:hypothetical protein
MMQRSTRSEDRSNDDNELTLALHAFDSDASSDAAPMTDRLDNHKWQVVADAWDAEASHAAAVVAHPFHPSSFSHAGRLCVLKTE